MLKIYRWGLLLGSRSVFALRFQYPKSFISHRISLRYDYIGQIIIGDSSSIRDFSVIVANNDKSNTLNNSGIIIGKNTYIGEFNNIRAGGGKIVIGNNCLISQHITIVASNHSIVKSKLICEQPWSVNKNFVIIKDDVWIGANAVIMPGVTIGTGAIIGAGSIVTMDIPEYAIAVGNPAKVNKYRE